MIAWLIDWSLITLEIFIRLITSTSPAFELISETFQRNLLTGRESYFADEDPAQVKLQRDADRSSDASWYDWNDNLSRGLARSVPLVLVEKRTPREVSAADAEVDRCWPEDADVAWKRVVDVQQHGAEIARLHNTTKHQHRVHH